MSMATPELNDEQLRALYAWIDAIPLSRPKKNMARDFSDGVLLAEVVGAYFPQLVELHNYAPANSIKQKHYNFETLNQRVLKKLGYVIPKETIDDIVCCRPGAVEFVLNTLQYKMAKFREKKASSVVQSLIEDSTGISPESSIVQNSENDNRRVSNIMNLSPRKPDKTVIASIDEEILMEKEKQIRELHETVEILELKIAKLEQLVRLKENKIQKLISANRS